MNKDEYPLELRMLVIGKSNYAWNESCNDGVLRQLAILIHLPSRPLNGEQ